jgi:MYXO-CTERM domain-containing protein
VVLGPLVIALLWAASASGDTTIYPANYSFEDDDTSSEGGFLEGAIYPSSWTFIHATEDQYLTIVNNGVWDPGYGGITGAQYCSLYGATVSPGITQTLLNDTVKPGAKYRLITDVAGDIIDPVGASVEVTLTLSAGNSLIAKTTITPDQFTPQMFVPFSTASTFPGQSLVGQPLTITITPGSMEPVGIDASYDVGVDNVRIIESDLAHGDANADGRVDVNDLTQVLTNYNQGGMTWANGDFNGDGTIDINDLTILLANYNTHASDGGPSAVPEPGATAMLAAGMLALLAFRRPRRRPRKSD